MTWQDDAACRGLGDLFFSWRPTDIAQAKNVCRTCPVLVDCRQWAHAHGELQHGAVWAGERIENNRSPSRRPRRIEAAS